LRIDKVDKVVAMGLVYYYFLVHSVYSVYVYFISASLWWTKLCVNTYRRVHFGEQLQMPLLNFPNGRIMVPLH